jgi:hypothetical protein
MIMTGRVLTVAFIALSALLGGVTFARADADFALFDNTNPATQNEGIRCTATAAFTYHITVSNWSPDPNVLRITYADCDITRFQIGPNGSFNVSGAARGRPNSQNADRTISLCGESPNLAGQMSAFSAGNATCTNIECAGGVPEGCPGGPGGPPS